MENDPEETYDIWSDKLPIPSLALSIVIFTIHKWELCVLTTKRIEWKEAWSALPVWIVKKWFNLEQNFDTILKEKTWITWVYKEQLYTFWDDVNQDPNWHVIAVSYFALVKIEDFLSQVDMSKVDMITIKQHQKMKWFYWHQNVIALALHKLKQKLWFTNIVKNFLPENFRISQMHKAYETILGREIDDRNFRKKIFSLKIIEETGKKDTSTNRPSKLYKFSSWKANMIDSL